MLKSTAVFGSMTTLSRASGLARDIILANLVGSTFLADAFFVAFRIPNFFRRIFGEGAFSAAFVPVYTQQKLSRPPEDVRRFVNLVTGRLGFILVLLVIIGVATAPLLISALAPGFRAEPEKFNLTVECLRLTFPYMFFVCMVAMSAAVLNTYGHFASPAFSPVLLNLTLIGAALWLTGFVENAAIAISIGVFAAGVIQLVFQLPFMLQKKVMPVPRIRLKNDPESREGVREVKRLMLPAIFGSSVAQLNLVINTFIASFLVTGSVSWLYYSDRLMEFPLGVFGVAIGTVILPRLSKVHAEHNKEEFSSLLNWGMRWCLIIAFPSTAGLIVLAEPMMTTLFFYGEFTATDVVMSSNALLAYAIGLTGLMAVRVLSPGFFARNNTKTPVNAGVVAMVANAILAIVLVQFLEHVGLALATSIAAFINAGILMVLLMRQNVYIPLPGWTMFLIKVGGASTIMGLALWWFKSQPSIWLEYSIWERIFNLTLLVVLGAVIYFVCLFVLGVRVHKRMPR